MYVRVSMHFAEFCFFLSLLSCSFVCASYLLDYDGISILRSGRIGEYSSPLCFANVEGIDVL
jgi:hypothetical protein